MFLRNPERQEDGMGREGRDYWEAQLDYYYEEHHKEWDTRHP